MIRIQEVSSFSLCDRSLGLMRHFTLPRDICSSPDLTNLTMQSGDARHYAELANLFNSNVRK